jgi:capsular polysaccharide biosynthesis protein
MEKSENRFEVPADLPIGSKIFISRRNWGARRPISNSERLEQLAVNRGYISVSPEMYSLPAQAKMIRSARVIVGEDGSALHNLIFAERDCTLGIISVPDRPNLWHMAICQSMGHRLSYIPAAVLPDGNHAVDISEYVNFLDRLEYIASF